MDMFGSSDEEDDQQSPSVSVASDMQVLSDALCSQVFNVLMKAKLKAPVFAANDPKISIEYEIALVTKAEFGPDSPFLAAGTSVTDLVGKLAVGKVHKISHIPLVSWETLTNARKFDTVVCLYELSVEDLRALAVKLMPKGRLLLLARRDQIGAFNDSEWVTSNTKFHVPIIPGHKDTSDTIGVLELYKRSVHCNQAGTLYWLNTTTPEYVQRERQRIEDICLPLMAQEVQLGLFSTATHEKALQIIQEYGVCIFPQLFPAPDVRAWGEAARADMKAAIQRLRTQHEVDLLALPSASADGDGSGEVVNVVRDNFHELSMREAYRCDLRNSPNVTAMHAQLPKLLDSHGRASSASSSTASGAGAGVAIGSGAGSVQAGAYTSTETAQAALTATKTGDASPVTTAAKIAAAYERCLAARSVPPARSPALGSVRAQQAPELRYHRGLLGVLTELFNPLAMSSSTKTALRKRPDGNLQPEEEVELEHGNWGKWNFNGPGPGTFTHPCVGKMAAVVSLPGCKDQTIHADTPHIFEHVHLPAHYLNFFLPCADQNEAMSAAMLKPPSRVGAVAVSEPDENGDVYVDEEVVLRDLIGTPMPSTSSTTATTAAPKCYFQGQTAFVVGSHHMSVAATVMTHPDAQIFLEERLVRPHLNTGDALIFDCRILHFGLSNWSHLKRESGAEKDWRIMMYVNYHQQWFQDPKNWNDAARLF